MNNQHQPPSGTIYSIFPIPIYQAHRESDLNSIEEKEIEDIIEEWMTEDLNNRYSVKGNSYIFDTRLSVLKEFCEQHIKTYVNEVINPQNKELDFYITQSWINVIEPGEEHQRHAHQNSIISGVFYIATEETDSIMFIDNNYKIKGSIDIRPKEFNSWNTNVQSIPVVTNNLILFPSWMDHMVQPNKKATANRISISFNTFVGGNLGQQENLNQLILQ